MFLVKLKPGLKASHQVSISTTTCQHKLVVYLPEGGGGGGSVTAGIEFWKATEFLKGTTRDLRLSILETKT